MKKAETAKMLQGLLPPMREAPPIAATEVCGCGGSGMVAVQNGKDRFMKDCVCRIQKRIDAQLSRAQIPERYRTKTLDTFSAMGGHASLGRRLAAARRYVEEYPAGTEGRGILMVGTVGIGKTHLAVGMLRELVLRKGSR